ncbi:MAG: CHAT domain-containing protein [Mucilaginibacter sp.]
MEIKTELLGKLTDISVPESILAVYSAIPSNKHLIGLKSRAKELEMERNSGELTATDYRSELAALRRSLFFFIDELKEAELKKVFITIVKGNNNADTSNAEQTMLFIAASPKDLDNLQVMFEYAAIKNVLAASINRDNFFFKDPVLAATIESVVDAINISKPTIIHFSGHAGRKGIILSDRNNNADLIPSTILEGYFDSFDDGTNCVFLNACYSVEQASIISKYSKYVIGMNCPIGDDAAVMFSEAFYRCLFNDSELNYEKAFKQASVKLQLRATAESLIPEIWNNKQKLIF